MSTKEKMIDFFYNFFYIVLLSSFLYLEIYDYYYYNLIDKATFLFVLLFAGVFCVLILLYNKIHFYIFPIIELIITGFLYFIEPVSTLEFISEHNLAILFLICLGAFFIFLLTDRSLIYQIIFAIGSIGYLIYMLIIRVRPYALTPVIVFTYALIVLVKIKQSKLKKQSHERTVRYVVTLIPFFSLFFLILFLLPFPKDPININWLKSMYYRAESSISNLFSGDSVFFDGTDKMSYRNDPNQRYSASDAIMTIQSSNKYFSGDMYLQGATFNAYKNGDWYNTVPDTDAYLGFDAFEKLNGFYATKISPDLGYVSQNKLNVTYKKFATDSIFMPASTMIQSFERDRLKSLEVYGDNVKLGSKKSYGFSYELDYLHLNYAYNITRIIEKKRELTTDNLWKIRSYFSTIGQYQKITKAQFNEYRNFIHKYYSSDFEIDSDVENWINVAAPPKYDSDTRLSLIIRQLSKMYYDSQFEEFPDSIKTENDFLHYFLIDNKKGFCVHYATAFCLLARHLGYPARVVQGYRVPVHGTDPADVYNFYGHAWVEVYIDGFGWVIFEPTSALDINNEDKDTQYAGSFSGSSSSLNVMNAKDIYDFQPGYNYIPADMTHPVIVTIDNETIIYSENGTVHVFNNDGEIITQGILKEHKDEIDNSKTYNEENENEIIEETYDFGVEKDIPITPSRTDSRRNLAIVLIVVIIIIAGILIWLAYKSMKNNKSKTFKPNFSKEKNSKLIIRYINEIQRCFTVLNSLDLTRPEGETLEEFNSRIKEHISLLYQNEDYKLPQGDLSDICPSFLNFYQEYRYGALEPTTEILDATIKDKKKLLNILKGISKSKYYVLKTKLIFVKI